MICRVVVLTVDFLFSGRHCIVEDVIEVWIAQHNCHERTAYTDFIATHREFHLVVLDGYIYTGDYSIVRRVD